MIIEELLRRELRADADSVTPIENLLETASRRGQRKRLARRAGIAVSGIAAAGMIAGVSLVVAGGTSAGGQQIVRPAAGGTMSPGQPWWQTWTIGRHDGPVDKTFLSNARPTYDPAKGPESIDVWATGTEPDGTDWVMFTDPHDGHQIQWLQGWSGQPDYGSSTPTVTPDMSWTSFSSPTLAAHDDYRINQQWLIIVGKPGTTAIEYAADGTHYSPLDVHDGIAVLQTVGFAPATAKVRLSDSTGVYATGTPYGAGAGGQDPSTSPSPDGTPGTATPTPTPGSGVSTAPSSAPPASNH